MIFGNQFSIHSYVKNEIGEIRTKQEQIEAVQRDLILVKKEIS